MFILFSLSLQKEFKQMKLHRILLLLLLSLFVYACSEPTMEEDARAAADLSMISNQCAIDNDITGAGEAYSKVQVIMDKYKELGQFNEFYELYGSFLAEKAQADDAKMVEQNAPQDSTAEKKVE